VCRKIRSTTFVQPAAHSKAKFTFRAPELGVCFGLHIEFKISVETVSNRTVANRTDTSLEELEQEEQ
jgi:hypothetical protein